MIAFILAVFTQAAIAHALMSSVYIDTDYYVHKKIHHDGVCSGFVVASNQERTIIATARHCTEDGLPTRVHFHDGRSIRVRHILRSANADVALLSVRPGRAYRTVTLRRQVDIGEQFFTIGAASGDPWSFSILNSRNGSHVFDRDQNDPALLFESAGVFLGDSGAGVFDEDGNVVGVIDAIGEDDHPGVVFVAPVFFVEDLLDGGR